MVKVTPGSVKSPSEEEETNDSWKEASAPVVAALRTAKHRVAGILVNALNFAMGYAWLGLANVLGTHSFFGDPQKADAWVLWLCSLVTALVCILLMGLLIWRKTKLEIRAKEAHGDGNITEAVELRVRAATLQTLMSWGCAFTLAGQLDVAAMASVPSSPWGWRALYVLLLFSSVSALAFIVAAVGSKSACCASETVQDGIAEAIVAGSAFGVAMAFLGTATAAFNLESVGMSAGSENLGYLAIFTVMTLFVVTLIFALLACAQRATHRMIAPEEESLTLLVRVGTIFHSLLAKTASMCGVVAIYALVYVGLSQTDMFGSGKERSSVFEPLNLRGAVVFLLVTVLATVAGGGLLNVMMQRMGKRLARVDWELVPGPLGHTIRGSLEGLMKTTAAALATAMAWLVGTAMHSVTTTVWEGAIVKGTDDVSTGVQITVAFAYSAVLTTVAVLSTLQCAPPPPGV